MRGPTRATAAEDPARIERAVSRLGSFGADRVLVGSDGEGGRKKAAGDAAITVRVATPPARAARCRATRNPSSRASRFRATRGTTRDDAS